MRHGAFVYEVEPLAADCGGAGPAAVRLKNMGMDHAWIKVHGYKGPVNDGPIMREFLQALRDLKVEPMAWGWCQGADGDIEREAALAIEQTARWDMTTYIADIEGDGTVAASRWSVAETRLFFSALKKERPAWQLGISSFALPELHGETPALLKAAAESGATIGAPQIYWFNHPSVGLAKRYACASHNPTAYSMVAFQQWSKAGFAELWGTGQAYWGEGGFTQAEAEDRLKEFLSSSTFAGGAFAGWNWWHAGGRGCAAMSDGMREAIGRWWRGREDNLSAENAESAKNETNRRRGVSGGAQEHVMVGIPRDEAKALAAAMRRMAGMIEAGT